MLNIIHAEDAVTPTQAYAHAAWHENPQISPAYWREFLGNTVSKIALDWRQHVSQTNLLIQGVNFILTSPTTYALACTAINKTSQPEAFVTAHVTPQISEILPATYLVWQIPLSIPEPEILTSLTQLEQAVKAGVLEAYGIHDPLLAHANTPRPLHQWLEWAAIAAEKTHGRRKRAALRVLMIETDLLNLAPFTLANTKHREESVSPLELAARLGLATIAIAPAFPTEDSPTAQALQALTNLAQAEHTLNLALEGWPSLHNQPLFSVLAALNQGVPPWPTPHHWQHWQTHLWPLMESYLQAHPSPQATALLNAVSLFIPYGPVLANAAAQPAIMAEISRISANLPPSWHENSPQILQSALLSSLPGLTTLALDGLNNIQAIQKLGDFSDPGILFTSAPHLS